jgi:hypothetical protein
VSSAVGTQCLIHTPPSRLALVLLVLVSFTTPDPSPLLCACTSGPTLQLCHRPRVPFRRSAPKTVRRRPPIAMQHRNAAALPHLPHVSRSMSLAPPRPPFAAPAASPSPNPPPPLIRRTSLVLSLLPVWEDHLNLLRAPSAEKGVRRKPSSSSTIAIHRCRQGRKMPARVRGTTWWSSGQPQVSSAAGTQCLIHASPSRLALVLLVLGLQISVYLWTRNRKFQLFLCVNVDSIDE